jgi:hypothetical protein
MMTSGDFGFAILASVADAGEAGIGGTKACRVSWTSELPKSVPVGRAD